MFTQSSSPSLRDTYIYDCTRVRDHIIVTLYYTVGGRTIVKPSRIDSLRTFAFVTLNFDVRTVVVKSQKNSLEVNSRYRDNNDPSFSPSSRLGRRRIAAGRALRELYGWKNEENGTRFSRWMAPGERKPVLFAPLSRFMRNKIAVKMFRTVSIRITGMASDGTQL